MQIHSLSYAPDPTALFESLAGLPGAVLLQSGNRRHYQSRYDILSADPLHSLSFASGHWRFGVDECSSVDPLGALDRALATMPGLPATPAGVPFSAGFIGLFGYSLHQYLERQSQAPRDPTQLPELLGGYYDWSVVTDHYCRTTTLFSHRSAAQTAQLLALLLDSKAANPSFRGALSPFQPSSTDADYARAFETIQAYIRAGDCYQANLARHYQARIRPEEGWALYKHLQSIQGSAFSAYLSHPLGSVLSLSPERLALRTNQGSRGQVETCPIKGTAPRLADPLADQARAARLVASEKNRAENLMIVDLLRNDLGRIANIGSVRTRTLFELVTLPNVHHLVSTISAEIPGHMSNIELLRSLLPGGSITGAPKIRAIDIINEVEARGRAAYCGSLGYIDHSGRMDMNIAIRTLALDPSGELHLWGGGAIVADSELQTEAEEIDHKIGALLRGVDSRQG